MRLPVRAAEDCRILPSHGEGSDMAYDGRLITDRSDAADQTPVLDRLATLGYRAPGARFSSLVKLYQSQHVDAGGNRLREDGIVGRATWDSLFGPQVEAIPPAGIAGAALTVAASQIGVREVPPGSNAGPAVEGYLASVGLDAGAFWCMAFVFWCFQRAAAERGVANPFPRTGGCLDAWRRVARQAPAAIVTREQALAEPSRVRPGAVFILDHGGGLGHTGFVSSVIGVALETIEGNSNDDGSRNGVGVFRLNRRSVTADTLKGFIDFTGA